MFFIKRIGPLQSTGSTINIWDKAILPVEILDKIKVIPVGFIFVNIIFDTRPYIILPRIIRDKFFKMPMRVKEKKGTYMRS